MTARPDFRARAAEASGDRWGSMSADERAAAIEAAKVSWLDERMGAEIEPPSFASWIAAQPARVQDDVLGPARARAFRAGKLEVRRYVDASAPLTMDEVEARALTPGPGRERT